MYVGKQFYLKAMRTRMLFYCWSIMLSLKKFDQFGNYKALRKKKKNPALFGLVKANFV